MNALGVYDNSSVGDAPDPPGPSPPSRRPFGPQTEPDAETRIAIAYYSSGLRTIPVASLG